MKKILLICLSTLLLCAQSAFAEDFGGLDASSFDFKFIDDPFAGQKMVSDKEFNQVLEQHKKKQNSGFFAKLFKKDAPPKSDTHDYKAPSEIGSLKDAIGKKPVVILGLQIIDSSGKTLESGHYQVSIKDSYMELSQGSGAIGRLKIKPATDDWEANSIIYARVLEVNEDYLKIIYSNLDETFEGWAKIKK